MKRRQGTHSLPPLFFENSIIKTSIIVTHQLTDVDDLIGSENKHFFLCATLEYFVQLCTIAATQRKQQSITEEIFDQIKFQILNRYL